MTEVGELTELTAATVEDEVVAYYRATVEEVFRYLVRLCGSPERAADLVQEVYVAALRELRRGRLVEPTAGWAIVVGRRKFLDDVRRARREERRLALAADGGDVVEPDWDAIAGGEALRLLGSLPDEQRAALVLRYVDDLPVVEVADHLDRTVAATESLLARGRRQLARLVEESRRA